MDAMSQILSSGNKLGLNYKANSNSGAKVVLPYYRGLLSVNRTDPRPLLVAACDTATCTESFFDLISKEADELSTFVEVVWINATNAPLSFGELAGLDVYASLKVTYPAAIVPLIFLREPQPYVSITDESSIFTYVTERLAVLREEEERLVVLAKKQQDDDNEAFLRESKRVKKESDDDKIDDKVDDGDDGDNDHADDKVGDDKDHDEL